MVLLSCVKLPDSLDVNGLSKAVKVRLGNKNEKYISEIEGRCDRDGVRASLGALLTLSLLLERLGLSQDEIGALVLTRNDNGKPYFENSSVSFSISHSHGYVACAVSDECKVGIDVESSALDIDRANKIAKRFFDGREAEMLNNDANAFSRAWTKKEAATKMCGTTLAEYLRAEKSGEMCPAVFFEFEEDGHPITLCADKHPSKIKRIELDLGNTL